MKSPLADTDEHEAIEDLAPEKLREMANNPASELFVVQQCLKCWVKRWVRHMRIKWAVVFGAYLVIQFGGFYLFTAAVERSVQQVIQKTAPLFIEPVVRKTVLEVLREHNLIAVLHRAAADPVVSLTPGGTK